MFDASEESKKQEINVMLESESWRFVGTKAHFGIYNKSGSDRIYKIQLREVKEEDLLP